MALARFPAIITGRMDGEMTRVEGSSDFLESPFLRRALQSFEEDYRTPAVRDLGKLQLTDMITQGGERRTEVSGTHRASDGKFPIRH